MLNLLKDSVWCFESGYYDRLRVAFVQALKAGGSMQNLYSFSSRPSHAPYMLASKYSPGFESLVFVSPDGSLSRIPSEKNSTALIHMLGPMTKAGAESSYGTADYIGHLQWALSNDNVENIVLVGDTPGGSADGTQVFADAIAQTNLDMPVVGYVDGMVASAGYWAMSQTAHITASYAVTTETGSIGTYFIYINERGFLEMNGLDVRIVRADKSTDKIAMNSLEEVPEAVMAAQQKRLNQVNDVFLGAVRQGRAGKLVESTETSALTGKMFGNKQAKKLGLIDAVGTLDSAISKARTLTKKRKLLNS